MARPLISLPLEERFWSKVAKGAPDACWVWVAGYTQGGYGSFTRKLPNGTWGSTNAHRQAYEMLVGPIPLGMVVDHLCRNRACVNPAHLEAVTNRANLLRGVGVSARNASKTHCVHGHAYTPENTKYKLRPNGASDRTCAVCDRLRRRPDRSTGHYQCGCCGAWFRTARGRSVHAARSHTEVAS